MQPKICNYIISFILSLLLASPLQAQVVQPAGSTATQAKARKQQKKKEEKEKKPVIEYPLYNGVSVGLDLWGMANKALGGDFMNSEVAVDVDLKHRYFPAIEVGYGGTDKWSDHGTHYKGKGPYFRIGMDYNAFYNKKHSNLLLVGLRYAASSFKYDINALGIEDPSYGGAIGNPGINDGIWGGSLPFKHQGMKGSMQWMEVNLAIRAQVWKSLYMGWSMRMRFKLSDSKGTYGNPWYVPGFGKYGNSKMGIAYHITYKLPW